MLSTIIVHSLSIKCGNNTFIEEENKGRKGVHKLFEVMYYQLDIIIKVS